MQVRQAAPGDGPLLCAAGLSGRFDALVLEKDGIAIGAALRVGAKALYRAGVAPPWLWHIPFAPCVQGRPARALGARRKRRRTGVFAPMRVSGRRAGAVPRRARRGR